MRVELGTPVRCSDGVFGELADLVIDPTNRRVTHLVVQPHREQALAGSRLVPVELADSAGDQSQITLHCTVHEVSKLEPVREAAFLPLGGFPVDDPDWDVGISNVLAEPYYGAGDLAGASYPTDVEMFYDRIPRARSRSAARASWFPQTGTALGVSRPSFSTMRTWSRTSSSSAGTSGAAATSRSQSAPWRKSKPTRSPLP